MSTGHTTAQCERDEHDFRFPVDSYGVPMTDGRYCSNCDRCEHCFREDRALELLTYWDDDAKIPDHDACPHATPDSEQEDYDADRLASAPCEDCGVAGHTPDDHDRRTDDGSIIGAR